MANFPKLIQSIVNIIKPNGNRLITGQVLQNTLLQIITAMGEGRTFAGIATPTTNPGNPDGNVLYFAIQAGTYTHFGNLQVQSGISIITNNASGAGWSVVRLMAPSSGGSGEINVTDIGNGDVFEWAREIHQDQHLFNRVFFAAGGNVANAPVNGFCFYVMSNHTSSGTSQWNRLLLTAYAGDKVYTTQMRWTGTNWVWDMWNGASDSVNLRYLQNESLLGYVLQFNQDNHQDGARYNQTFMIRGWNLTDAPTPGQYNYMVFSPMGYGTELTIVAFSITGKIYTNHFHGSVVGWGGWREVGNDAPTTVSIIDISGQDVFAKAQDLWDNNEWYGRVFFLLGKNVTNAPVNELCFYMVFGHNSGVNITAYSPSSIYTTKWLNYGVWTPWEKVSGSGSVDTSPLVVERIIWTNENPVDYSRLLLRFNKPVPTNSYLQIWRQSKKGGGRRFRAMDMRPQSPPNEHIFPVIALTPGITELRLTKAQFDQLYVPPVVRSKNSRTWAQWAATQSGKRHNPINIKRDTKALLKFSVAGTPDNPHYNRGLQSIETLQIQKYVITYNGMLNTTTMQVRIY